MKLASPRLIVSDIKKTLAFYIDVLGFKTVGIFPDKNQPAWATLAHEERDIDRFTMMFLDYPQMDPESYDYLDDLENTQKGVGINFYFDISDVEDLYQRITAKGMSDFVHDIETMPYGLREFTIKDPDGYELTFCQEVEVDQCLSCGMPLNAVDVRGGHKEDSPHCHYCTDSEGNLLSRQEVEDKMTAYLIENGAPEDEARDLACEVMAGHPAWQK